MKCVYIIVESNTVIHVVIGALRRETEIEALITRSEEDRERYKESNKRVHKLMKQAQNQWVNNQCKEIEEQIEIKLE